MITKSTLKLTSAAVAAALFLAACGGGSGGSPSAASPATGASGTSGTGDTGSTGGTGGGTSGGSVTTPDTTPKTSVPAPTYSAATFQSAAFTLVNNYRSAMGVGLFTQDPLLDTAAQAHALYLRTNLQSHAIADTTHDEISGNANYYADTPLARAQKAGVPTTEWVGEVAAGGAPLASEALTAADCINQFLNTVYHLSSLMFSQETIGIGYSADASLYMCVSDMGTITGVSGTPGANSASYSGGQQIPTNIVVHSPYSNEVNVSRVMHAESPNPAIDLPAPGRPILVRVNAANLETLTVSQFTLTSADGTVVPARILVPSSAQASSTATTVVDPNNALPIGSAVLLPLAPLAANTTYTVTFSGTRNGVAISATPWTFTTGS